MPVLQVVCPHCFVTNRVPAGRLSAAPTCGKCGAALFTGKPVPVSTEQFRKFSSWSQIPVVVDFWATWCAPCRTFAPVYAQASAHFPSGMHFLKVDTEQNPALVAELAIRSIPTLAVFRGGQELGRQAGAMPARPFIDWLKGFALLDPA